MATLAPIAPIQLNPTQLTRPVLSTISDGSADAATTRALTGALSDALTKELAGAAMRAGYTALAQAIEALSPADIVADQKLSLRAFAEKAIALPTDQTSRATIESAIRQMSSTTTVAQLLQLDAPVESNPYVAGIVAQTDLTSLLRTSPALSANAAAIATFVTQYATYQGSMSAFWTSLSQNDQLKSLVPELQLTLQLGTLTQGNTALVAAVRAKYPQMTSPRTLATMSVSDWEALVTSAGGTPSDQVTPDATAIAGTLTAAFPGTVFGQQLHQQLTQSGNEIDRGVATVLSNASDLDLLETNLATYLSQNQTTVFKGVTNTNQMAVTQQLATWQRVARVSSDFTMASALLSGGYTSAYSIASSPRAAFLQALGGPLGSTAAADAVYRRAQQIASTAMALFTTVRQGLTAVPVRAIGGGAQAINQSGIPNWQTLFGSLSSCACSDCRSVYSAAAYFVDLLQFLAKSPTNGAGQTPLQALLTRRPDLPYLKLNCVNTNTELPYVDLVNEILESFVFHAGTPNIDAAHDTPKRATAAELSVSPEYTLAAVYNSALRTAIFPPTLPYDRWLLTARTYLGFLGSSLAAVMQSCQTGPLPATYSVPLATLPAITLPAFVTYNASAKTLSSIGLMTADAQAELLALSTDAAYTSAVNALYAASQAEIAADSPSRIAVACETLLISDAECVILTGADFTGTAPTSPPSLWQYYGLTSSTNWETTVAPVEMFLQSVAITYDDLVALLKTRALNPTLSIMLQASGTDPCDLSQTTIVDLSQPKGVLQDTTLDHMHRFIRLWKKLGWSIPDLDAALTALGPISQQLLIELAAVQQLMAATGLPLASVLSFWSDIPTDGRRSLYLSLFQNTAVLNPPNPAFQLTYTAPLASLPVVQCPSPMFPNVGYISLFGFSLLTLQGVMSDAEYAQLSALSSDPSFSGAIGYLHTHGSAGVTTMTALASLPVATFPPTTPPGLLTYNTTTHMLSYVGAMSDDYRDQLNFSSDAAYQTAIDALYRMRTLFGTDLVGSVTLPGITNNVYPILAALRISAQDLAALRTYTGLADTTTRPVTPLTLANLSTLTRYALLAQSQQLSVSDLLTVIALAGVDPFVDALPTATLAFVQTAQAIQALAFSIAELNYVYRNVFDPNAGIAPVPSDVNLLLTTLQAGLAGIAHADAIVPDPKGALLAKAVATALGGSVASAAIGLITGTGIYSAPLAALPAVVLPGFVTYNSGTQTLSIVGAMTSSEETQLLGLSPDPTYQAAVISLYQTSQAGGVATYTQSLAALPAIGFPAPLPVTYDGASQMLRITGPMTTVQQTALLALSADPAYQAAVSNLYQQPVDFIDANLAAFLTPSVAITQLIETVPPLSVADKVAYVAAGLMPYLQQIESESLIKQTLSNNLSLDPSLCDLLLNTVLRSQIDSGTEYAMADFLALVGDGLSASYYATGDLTGSAVATRVDPAIGFNWGFGLPNVPVSARPFSVRWSGWVMPQYSEAYTFYVEAGDGVRLSINGQLIINSWTTKTPTELSGTVQLTAGQLYAIELDYFDQTAPAAITLGWSSPSTPKGIVPQSQLFSGTAFSSLTPIVTSYTLLYKTTLLVTTFPLTAADVAYLCQHGGDFAGTDPANPAAPPVPFDPNLLPLTTSTFTPALFNQWERLNALVALKKTVPGGDAGLLGIFAAAAASTTITLGTLSGPVTAAVLAATTWNATDLAYLVSASGFNLSDADFKNEQGTKQTGLTRLQACEALIGRLGVSAQQLFTWAAFGPDPAIESAIAADMQSAVKAKYDDATWVTVGKPLNDAIREASKEALIAYILANATAWGMAAPDGGGPLTTSDQLYEYFLIDVNMSPCMLTSRIVQASAAVQLFVQRAVLNLEAAVSPSAIDPAHWSWLQNFRVWQANRMVLLYPENWIVPTLRDDMTPLFQDLENTLLQNPLTADSVEQAYLTYLNGLNAIARLDIRASYYQYDPDAVPAPDGTADATNDVLHVFGRTQAQPYNYYYRRLQTASQFGQPGGGSAWTHWEALGLSIDGDHLIPVLWDGRLFVFWPTFVETAEPSTQSDMQLPPSGATSYSAAPPMKDLNVTLYWSEYRQGAWSPKQSSDPWIFEQFTGWGGPGPLDPSKLSFNTSFTRDDSLVINIMWNRNGNGLDLLGWFTFSSCGSAPIPSASVKPTDIYTEPAFSEIIEFPSVDKGLFISYDFLHSDPQTTALSLAVGYVPVPPTRWGVSYTSSEVDVLATTPNSFQLMFPQQWFESFGLMVPPPFTVPSIGSGVTPGEPFFFEDPDRVYFVTESFSEVWKQVRDPNTESGAYSRASLLSLAVPLASTDLVFTKTSPDGASRTALQSGDQQRGTSVSRQGQKPVLSQILFTNHFHPFLCSFIGEVNRYGVSELLTLRNQQRTNDGGVLSGFVLSPSLTATPKLTAGVLIAQDKVYAPTSPPNPGPAPKDQSSFLYYNSSSGFYYASGVLNSFGTTDTPNTAGDAVIGEVTTDASGRVVTATSFTNIQWATVFNKTYAPTASVDLRYPEELVDFGPSGAYSIYNWELFFHIPVLIATQLDQNQQFETAETWWRYVFDPMTASTDPIPQRYWQFLPFYQCSPSDIINAQIQNIFYPPTGSGTPPAMCGEGIADQISAWQEDPFNPFLIARMRTVAFRLYVVMNYIQHRIAWGDYLFQQNTRESINEATLHYVFAKELLGPAPVEIPARGAQQDYTYNDLLTLYGLDDFSNALVLLENDFPYLSTSGGSSGSGLGSALSMSSTMPYFCFPPNSNLTALWSMVEDRLYKIRHCMNIQGQVEQLALFAPPISPALLVAATAGGVDLSSVLSNTNAGTPFYRFTAIVQRALDLCNEVRAFGGALLTALEKQDAESLALLQATQATNLFTAMQQMKQAALQDAQMTVTSLNDGLQLATAKQAYYQSLINGGLTAFETQQLTSLQSANAFQQSSQGSQQDASTVAEFPNVDVGVSGLGSPVATATFGSQQLVASKQADAEGYAAQASQASYDANRSGILGQWDRRSTDWGFQLAQATQEIVQITDQITGAGFRVQVAEQDLDNLTLQIKNAQAVQDFLQSKYTSTQLYSWMVTQTSTVFFQCYQNGVRFGHAWRSGISLRARAHDLELHPVRLLGQPEERTIVWRAVVCGSQAHGAGVSRDRCAGVRDREADLARIVRSVGAHQSQDHRAVHGQLARSLLRPGLPGPLFSAHQDGQPHDSVRHRPVHDRQLYADPAQQQDPGRQLGEQQAGFRERRPLHYEFRGDAIDRDQHGPGRRRDVRGQFPRRALPAVRGGWRDLDLATRHADRLQCVRLRYHHQCRAQPPVHLAVRRGYTP